MSDNTHKGQPIKYKGDIYLEKKVGKTKRKISVDQASDGGHITVDEQGDIWLAQDIGKRIKITGDLTLGED